MENISRTKFRVRYKEMKALLVSLKEHQVIRITRFKNRHVGDTFKVAVEFGFLEPKENEIAIFTERGDEMVSAYQNEETAIEKRLLCEALRENDEFRELWAWSCDGRTEFTVRDIIDIFKEIGYSDLADKSLQMYVRTFVDWGRSAGLCRGIGGRRYRIKKRMLIGADGDETTLEDASSPVTESEDTTEALTRLSLLTLNAHICDYLADETHEGDLNLIKAELESLRNSEILDDLVIDMLEREMAIAMETRNTIAFAMLAQSLRDIRARYLS